MWSGAWNKTKLTSQISNRFLPSTVSRALDWWSGGCGFKPHCGQFLTKFILCCVTSDLSDILTEMRQILLSWKTRIFSVVCVTFVGHAYPLIHWEPIMWYNGPRTTPGRTSQEWARRKHSFTSPPSPSLTLARFGASFYGPSCSHYAWWDRYWERRRLFFDWKALFLGFIITFL